MIQLNHLSYRAGKKILLEDISATFVPAQLSLILGPNGAGKSTLIKLICQQLAPSEGTIYLSDRNLHSYPEKELAKVRAVLSQHLHIQFPIRVKEVVMMGRFPHFLSKPSRRDQEICEETMAFFDILSLSERNYLSLSGGEQQRVQFARVMAQIWGADSAPCRYLIMDEPLTFLDLYYQYDFMHKVRSMVNNSNLVVIGVIHDLNLAARFADQLILLHQGKILAQGNATTVLSAAHIEQAYRLKPTLVSDPHLQSLHLFFE